MKMFQARLAYRADTNFIANTELCVRQEPRILRYSGYFFTFPCDDVNESCQYLPPLSLPLLDPLLVQNTADGVSRLFCDVIILR
jgi:hypothetical protein